MIKVPSIKGSAQARLLLYRLLAVKLTKAEEQLLSTDPSLWERLLLLLEESLASQTQENSDRITFERVFSFIEKTTREGLQKQIERLTSNSLWLGVHPSALLDSFIEEHKKLVKSVQREQLDEIGLAIHRGIREGQLQKDMAKKIRLVTNISKRRAQLIARNAPLHYSGLITKHHQISAGIKSYIWQSSRDERVRDSHRKYDGEIFIWDSPGPHPRSEVNCRCDAVPFIA